MRDRRRAAAMGMALAACVLSAGHVYAETSANKAVADALFAEGRALVSQGKWAEACEKFIESDRFEPAVGTSLNLGECHEQLGRTASAYGAFGEAKRLAKLRGDTDREAHAAERRAKLEPRLSKIALRVPANTPSVKVLLDGRELGSGALGAAIPVDPGRHVVKAVAPDKLDFEKELMVIPGPVTVAVEIVFSGDKPGSDPVQWSTARSAGVVVGAAGAVAGLAGAGFGIAAIVKNNASKTQCEPDDPTKCTLVGVSLRNRAGTFADISTGALVGGGVLVGAGLGLYLLGGSNSKDKPEVGQVKLFPVISPGHGGFVGSVEF